MKPATECLWRSPVGSRTQECGSRFWLTKVSYGCRKTPSTFHQEVKFPPPNITKNVGLLAQAIAEVVPCYVSPSRGAFMSRGNGDVPLYCQSPADPSTYECREETLPWLLETLLIEGHTDDVPVAAGRRFRDNLELSSIRAATVQRMIIACEPGVEIPSKHTRLPHFEYERVRCHPAC